MASEDYGVVYSDVSAEFPDFPGFSATSMPTATQVTARIAIVAGEANGYLTSSGYTTAAIAATDDGKSYMARTIVLGVAAWCARSMRSAQGRADELQNEFRRRLQALRDDPSVLGVVYEPTSQEGGIQVQSATDPEAGRLRLFRYSQSRDRLF